MKKSKMFGIVVLTVLLIVGLTGSVLQQTTLKFVAIAKSLNNPAFQVAEKGARDRVAELGDVDLEWTAPTAADAAEMVQMIEELYPKRSRRDVGRQSGTECGNCGQSGDGRRCPGGHVGF